MSTVLQMAEIGALMGDPARANILLALGDGRALPAGELAYAARVTPQTASGHLARLVAAGLLSVVQQGRHRYYRLASERVGTLLESLLAVAAEAPPRRIVASRADAALRAGRTCYNHLAGQLGVALAEALQDSGHVHLAVDASEVTARGLDFFASFGLELPQTRRHPYCRTCIDWSERRLHVAGELGSALCSRLLSLGWITHARDSRAVMVTEAGEIGLRSALGVVLGTGPRGAVETRRA
ncbi:MAG TPA: helix-turn-helix transcriptional regulator [Acetobacteraceae bacterium]|nr:helix-turn-helix transcriptional regulator [Acetobacteraceae bacterium]